MRKKEKKHIHSVDFGGSIYGKKRTTGKRVSPNHKSVKKKDLVEIYNKFYRDQVAALYKAIHEDN